MANSVITKSLKDLLVGFLKKNKKADLLTTYFFFLEKKYSIQPVLFLKEKTIYQSKEEILKKLEETGISYPFILKPEKKRQEKRCLM